MVTVISQQLKYLHRARTVPGTPSHPAEEDELEGSLSTEAIQVLKYSPMVKVLYS